MIEDGLHQLMAADAGVTAIAGDRIYPVNLPETMLNPDTTVPAAATYQVITQVPDYTLDGPDGMVLARIQIDTWATTYAAAKALARALRVVLDGFAGPLPDDAATEVQNIWRENAARDDFDRNARLYRVSADYRVIYAEQ